MTSKKLNLVSSFLALKKISAVKLMTAILQEFDL